jgi:hypothetical protein
MLGGEDFTEVIVTPAGFEPPSFDATCGGVLLFEEIECHMPQHDKVLLAVVLPHATAIFLKGQIEYPMQPIFDAPMASDRVSKGLGIAWQARHVGAPFAGGLLTYPPLRFDHAHTAQPSPRLLRIERGDHFRIGNRPRLTPLHSAMSVLLR